jgi:hypothetical protein
MISKDLSHALDPVLLARDCGITPDPWQAALLRDRPRRALLCCARQTGKSLCTALMALWTALYEAPALVAILSPSQRQSAEMFRSLMLLYSKLEGAPVLTQESVLRAELSNGSRILSMPGTEKTVRGLSKVTLAILDEAARVEDELLAAVRPMLAVSEGGGRLIALSTPFGRRGWFHNAWHNGGDGWTRVQVSAEDCPRITKEFLEEELKQLGAMRFSEEYQLAWLDSDEAVWNTAIIDAAFTEEVRPLWQ